MNTAESEPVKPAAKPRIAIADDETHVRVYLKSILAPLGVEVVGEAANGEEAIRIYRELRPDLLLMDVNMPIMTGDEALKTIKQEFARARIVMLSSLADRSSVETCIRLGASNYLRKDTPVRELIEIIKEALQEPAA